jgi:outer membrane protein TolC
VARATTSDVRRTIAVGTARAYLTVLLAHRTIDSSLRAVKNAQDHLDFARKRRESGYGNRIDEVRAEQEVVTSELQLEVVYVQLVRSREALGVLCGGQGPLDVVQAAPRLTVAGGLDALLSDAHTERADLRLLRTRVHGSQHFRKLLWTYYAPSLNLLLQPFIQDPRTLTLPLVGFQGTLTLSIPLFDATRYGIRDERDALLAEARASLEVTVQQADAEVRAAYAIQERNARTLELAREGARLGVQALDLANLAYRSGAGTNLEVIDAERRARDADTAVALAEDALEQARLDVLVAAGRFP